MKAKLFRVGGLEKYIRSILEEGDINKLVKASLIGLVFDGFTWLRPLIHELATLYVYIYNDRRILPFGSMQHVIEGGYTWSITLGDLIDPETNSLIDVKSSVKGLQISPLIRMSVELRMPIHIVVSHYVKGANGKPDTSKIYLSIYRLRYKLGQKPRIERLEKTLYAEVPEELLKIRRCIKALDVL